MLDALTEPSATSNNRHIDKSPDLDVLLFLVSFCLGRIPRASHGGRYVAGLANRSALVCRPIGRLYCGLALRATPTQRLRGGLGQNY